MFCLTWKQRNIVYVNMLSDGLIWSRSRWQTLCCDDAPQTANTCVDVSSCRGWTACVTWLACKVYWDISEHLDLILVIFYLLFYALSFYLNLKDIACSLWLMQLLIKSWICFQIPSWCSIYNNINNFYLIFTWSFKKHKLSWKKKKSLTF